MRTALLLGACLALASCAYEYDAAGTLYPPDLSCSDLDACFKAQEGSVNTCLEAIPESPADYFGAMWACFEGTGCFHEDTKRDQVEDFFGRCWAGDVDPSGTLDAAWRDTFWTEFGACVDGAKADQESLIDLCYTL